MTEETFGPTLPIMAFDGDDRAVALANDSVYGLTASVWTRNRKRAAWFADRLEAGSVTVNDHMYSFCEPRAIWGGIKQTGMGRSHGPYGLHELVNIKNVGTDFFRKKAQTWWFPYDASLSGIMEKAIVIFHSGRLRSKMRAILGLRKEWRRLAATAPLLNYVRALPRILKK
jgi:succinate-semialdehyde dehydrogenase/glutarate-semialdehyde dehydrogenase